MSLPSYLANIKSSGIYRFVWDKSEVANVDAETLRLVVGYSEIGPFNTPVYIDSKTKFTNIFGGINKKLERYGVYFHRMALQALDAGPIIALNLKKFATENVEETQIPNTDRYYDNVDSTTFDAGTPIFDATTLSTKIAENIKQILLRNCYDTTRFWTLSPETMQDAVNKAFDNEQTPAYITLSATDDKSASRSIFVRGYTPSGMNITVRDYYNTQSGGESMPDFLEGSEEKLIQDFWLNVYVFNGEFTAAVATSKELCKYFDVDANNNVCLKPYLENAYGEKIDTLDTLAKDPNSGFINNYIGCTIPEFKNNNNAYQSLDIVFNADNDTHKMMMSFNKDALYDGTILVDNIVTDGWVNAAKWLVSNTNFQLFSNSNVTPAVSTIEYDTTDHVWEETVTPDSLYTNLIQYKLPSESVEDLPEYYSELALQVGDRFLSFDSTEPVVVTLTAINIDKTTDPSTVTFVFDNEYTPRTVSGDTNTYYLVKCNHICSEVISPYSMLPLYLAGYTKSNAKPATNSMTDKLEWQNGILQVLSVERGLRTGLTSRNDIDYRYIVDTFESFVDTELKAKITSIAKEKDNAVALVNFPSVQTFRKCDYTSFTDAAGVFQTKYIATGGNPAKNRLVYFSLPSENNGASFASFNTPIKITDGTLTHIVPSAAVVSNKFMEKYSGRQPYYIVAGLNYGRITTTGLVGPDFNYAREDLDILEPMGVNAMVYVPRQGTYINSNQTAKQTPVTALSKLNIRELVIYLQDEIEKLLRNYQWEFNTQALRDTIKSKADTICENIKANGGIYDYYNLCNTQNNTPEVIDNEMFVLSTTIEPSKGCGKMVQELTITRTGGISSVTIQ